jgi:hypothetical protein
MKNFNTKLGGNKVVFEEGDWVEYKNIWGNDGLAIAIELESIDVAKKEWEGKPVIFSNFVEDGARFRIKHTIEQNPHKVIDCFRYVIQNQKTDGTIKDYLLHEVYLKMLSPFDHLIALSEEHGYDSDWHFSGN